MVNKTKKEKINVHTGSAIPQFGYMKVEQREIAFKNLRFNSIQFKTLHLLLLITRKYTRTIINANLKLINAKIHSFYSIDINWRRYATICIERHSIALTDDH